MTLLVCRTDRFSSTIPALHRVIQRASPHGTRTDGPSDFPLRYCSSFSPPASVKRPRAEWDGGGVGVGMRSFVSPELGKPLSLARAEFHHHHQRLYNFMSLCLDKSLYYDYKFGFKLC